MRSYQRLAGNAPSPKTSRCLQEVAPIPAAPRGGCSSWGAAEGLHLLGGTPQPLCTLQEEAASLVPVRCGAGSLRWVSLGCQPRFLGQTAGCMTKGPENRFFALPHSYPPSSASPPLLALFPNGEGKEALLSAWQEGK